MSRFLTGLLVVLVVSVVALTGCGGGGGSSNGTPNPPPVVDQTERTITGKIVSTAPGNPPLANVAVTVGWFTAVSGADGTFRVGPMATSAYIPATFKVDAAGAGESYRRDDLITFNSQEYLFDAIDTPVALRNGNTNDLGTIAVRYAPEDAPSFPFPNKDTVIAGRVVRSNDQNVGIANVTVRFGSAHTVTTTTGKGGYFAINLGRNVDVISVFSVSDKSFSIDTSTAGSAYPTTLKVQYLLGMRDQNNIPVPDEVFTDNVTDLDNIVVNMTGSSGGSGGDDGVPDPPPFF